jgi:hypothetical protein
MLVNIGFANLHTDSFGGSQAVPCGQKDGRTERHDKKNIIAEACEKVRFCEIYDKLAAEYGRVASCYACEQRMAVIKDSET